MKQFNILVATLLVLSLAGCSKSYDITGTWVSQDEDNGRFTYFIFNNDGTCKIGGVQPSSSSSGGWEARDDRTYAFIGDNLTLHEASFSEMRTFNTDGSLDERKDFDSKEYTGEISWESDDLFFWKRAGGENKHAYKRVKQLPVELRF